MGHLFLFSNIIAAMIGTGSLILLLIAYFHSKSKAPLYAFLLFLAATTDYFLFILATYFFKILQIDVAHGFSVIQSVGIVLTGILIYGIPALYRIIAQLDYTAKERLVFALGAVLVTLPFLSAVIAGAQDTVVQTLRLIQLGTEFVSLLYAAISSLVYAPTVLSLQRKRLIQVAALLHLLIVFLMATYNFFVSADLLEFAYVLFYLSWALILLRYALLLLPFHPAGTKRVDIFCKAYKVSKREKEIIDLVLEGKSNQKIAEKLYISPRTVDTHLSNIYRKCGVEGRFALIKRVESQH